MKALIVQCGPHECLQNCSQQPCGFDLRFPMSLDLIPSGKLEPGPGDPENVLINLDGHHNPNVHILSSNEVSSFEIIKEFEVMGGLLLAALEYLNIRKEFENQQIELRDWLSRERVTPDFSALHFLYKEKSEQ